MFWLNCAGLIQIDATLECGQIQILKLSFFCRHNRWAHLYCYMSIVTLNSNKGLISVKFCSILCKHQWWRSHFYRLVQEDQPWKIEI